MPTETAPTAPTARIPPGAAVAVGVAVLAVAEAANALLAPLGAPDEGDWRGAAAEVRAGFKPGDLIVAAPAWADQVMRLHLGDLVPGPVTGRLDADRFGRIWEISQRGARSPESAQLSPAASSRHGALTVRRFERPAAAVSYDFIERWTDARVFRVETVRGQLACPLTGNRFQCPDHGWNFVRRQTVEVDGQLHRALFVQPVDRATVAVEYPAVQIGRELVVGAGLHNVWARKLSEATVTLRVLVEGRPLATIEVGNRTGWKVTRADTTAFAGRPATVRFEITSAAPYGRHFAFAAEARR